MSEGQYEENVDNVSDQEEHSSGKPEEDGEEPLNLNLNEDMGGGTPVEQGEDGKGEEKSDEGKNEVMNPVKEESFDMMSMSQSQSQTETSLGGIKRKREDDDDEEDEEDSNESKKMKESEGETKIQEGMLPFDNNSMGHGQFPNPGMSGMPPNLNQMSFPNPGMSGMPPSMSGQIPPNMMRMGPGFGMAPPPGYFMNKPPGFDNQQMPPPGWGQNPLQPFRAPPQPVMYQKEYYVEVDPFFQQVLHRSPPIDGLTEKLPSSKTPVIDAFIYCAICNWGVSISPSHDRLPNIFTISDFNKYWEYSQKICSKPAPTETQVARLKALRRWFADFPGIKKKLK